MAPPLLATPAGALYAAPAMAGEWTLGARLRRLGATVAAPRVRPIRIEGETVQDRDVASRYPGAVSRDIACHRWAEQRDDTSSLHLIQIDRAVVTRFYLPIDPERRWLFQNHSYDGLTIAPPPDFPVDGSRFRIAADTPIRIHGRAVLIGGPVEGNYSHALFNWFMRFLTLDLLAPEIARDPAVRFLVDERGRQEPFRSMLNALGVPLERVRWVNAADTHVVDRAILVSFTSENAHYPELLDLLRTRLLGAILPPSPPPPTRRVWISREHLGPCHRRVSNMDAIRPLLARHRVEEVALETLSFGDQVRLFSEAELVTGSHGAGFANIIFCQPGARIAPIEKDFNRLLRFDRFFSSLATICGLTPRVIPGATDKEPDRDYVGFFDRHSADVVVDPALLAEVFEGLA